MRIYVHRKINIPQLQNNTTIFATDYYKNILSLIMHCLFKIPFQWHLTCIENTLPNPFFLRAKNKYSSQKIKRQWCIFQKVCIKNNNVDGILFTVNRKTLKNIFFFIQCNCKQFPKKPETTLYFCDGSKKIIYSLTITRFLPFLELFLSREKMIPLSSAFQ